MRNFLFIFAFLIAGFRLEAQQSFAPNAYKILAYEKVPTWVGVASNMQSERARVT